MQKQIALVFLVGIAASAQSVLVPSVEVCPPGQVQIATQTATLGTYAVLGLSCATLGSGISINKSVALWAIQGSTCPTCPTCPAITTPGAFVSVIALNSGPEAPILMSGTSYGLAHSPLPGSMLLFKNGILLDPRYDYSTGGTPIGQNATVSGVLTAGALSGVTALIGGSSYLAAAVSVTGDGSGALAHPVIGLGGVISQVVVDAPGSAYTTITLTIIPVIPALPAGAMFELVNPAASTDVLVAYYSYFTGQ
jgi:hypothetical protein